MERNVIHADEVRARFSKQELSNMKDQIETSFDGCDDILEVFAIKHSVRRTLPYGKWTCADGREVLFNREYQPIMQRKDGVVSYADHGEWVENIVSHEYFYDDSCDPVDILVRKFHLHAMPVKSERAECQKSLLICMSVLKEFTPKELGSTNRQWSVHRG
jgi:hypothetical protein